MVHFDKLDVPAEGGPVILGESIIVPDKPVILFIEGDGTGPDITRAMKIVLDGAVHKVFGDAKKLCWHEIYAGQKAKEMYGEYLPRDTLEAIKQYCVAIKGPLETPVGGGIRSLNVTLRQELDLYQCVRPCQYIKGVPAPVVNPGSTNIVIFRENTEDVYAGIEWKKDSPEAKKIIDFLKSEFNVDIRPDSGIGIKPMSEFGSKRLVRAAIKYALKYKQPRVTLVHKGNIMKYTEGSFRTWGYEVAMREFRDEIVTEDEVTSIHGGKIPDGKLLVNDRIADNMFQQVLLRPSEYSVVATPNLNGDYLSDAIAAQIGGLGMAPGANIGDHAAVFEATHGTAPKYAGQDKVNPGSLILSGVMMLEYLGWDACARLVKDAMERTIAQKIVTYDLARQLGDVTPVKSSEFARAIVKNMLG